MAKKTIRWRWGCAGAAVAGVGLLVAGCEWMNGVDYSDGNRVGVVVKLSRKGVFWKTWEGVVAVGGGDGQVFSALTHAFSVDRQARHGEDVEALERALDEAATRGTRVKIRYVEALFGWPWRGETDYFVQSVEPAEPETPR